MANTKSAKKAVKTNERRRVRNQAVRSAVKTAFKKANEILSKTDKATKKEAKTKSVMEACSSMDKAASKGIIHANTAARKKSRLAKKLNKLTAK